MSRNEYVPEMYNFTVLAGVPRAVRVAPLGLRR